MPYKAKTDLVGRIFGRLTVISRDSVGIWKCMCSCGTTLAVSQNSLVTSNTKSCGCLRSDTQRDRLSTHGMNKSELHKRWMCMKSRCHPSGLYFSKGIRVCSEWSDSFPAFMEWALSSGYRKDLEIDRIDNNGDYEPKNCRWVTRSQNQRNRDATVRLTAFGETKSIHEWSEDSRCPVLPSVILWRTRFGGWVPEEAITHPSGVRRSLSMTKNAIRRREKKRTTKQQQK